MANLMKLLRNPAKFIFILNRAGIGKFIPDKYYLKIRFKASMGKRLNLKNPQTFSEKLQWLKLYNRNPEYTPLVDKYRVKQYVADKIGEEYVIPTLGVWNSVEEIDFDALPNRFVLKCTHDSGGLVICKDKSTLDLEKAKESLRQALKNDFYFMAREWPYKDVERKIIAEQYMEDAETQELRDYKFFCFDVEPNALFIASDRPRDTRFDFYDMEFNHLPFTNGYPNASKEIKKPLCFEQMRKLAGVLSQGMPHVRVDFYEVNGKIYFGEMTFFHHSGMCAFDPEEWDYTFGSWLTLPEKRRG